MKLNLIWAQTRTGVIGVDGHLPWENIPEDLRHFRDLTRGNPVIMGSKTWRSLPPQHRPLPGRRNIVLTSHPDQYPNVETHPNLDAALAVLASEPIVWIIGGGQLYDTALDLADELHVTEVDIDTSGDTRAPDIVPHMWEPTPINPAWLTSTAGLRYRFITYVQA